MHARGAALSPSFFFFSGDNDALGNTLTETDALGNVTSYEYDERNRLVEVTLPDPDGGGAKTPGLM
jgi:YD repeat-containing protein